MPAGDHVATAARTAALLGLLLVAPALSVKLIDTMTYQNCKASTTCTKMCAVNARAPRVTSTCVCAGARDVISRTCFAPSPAPV